MWCHVLVEKYCEDGTRCLRGLFSTKARKTSKVSFQTTHLRKRKAKPPRNLIIVTVPEWWHPPFLKTQIAVLEFLCCSPGISDSLFWRWEWDDEKEMTENKAYMPWNHCCLSFPVFFSTQNSRCPVNGSSSVLPLLRLCFNFWASNASVYKIFVRNSCICFEDHISDWVLGI